MVVAAYEQGIHLVLCGAAGGMSDPTMVRVGDLVDVADDRLLASVRRELRKRHGFPKGVPFRKGGGGRSTSPPAKGFRASKDVRIQTQSHASKASAQWGVPCVYSLERTEKMQEAGTLCDRFGTACFATGAFGFAAAAQLTGVIARGEKLPKRPRIGPPPADQRDEKPTPQLTARREVAAATDADTPTSAGSKAAGKTGGASRRSDGPRMAIGDAGAASFSASAASGTGESSDGVAGATCEE